MERFISGSDEQTEAIATEFAQTLSGTETIAFFGGLGMGKTTFVRGLAEGLECIDRVSSPTFAIVNEYSGRFKVYHFDMYRITSWDDLYSIGFFDYLGQGLLVIEWSENIENALPDNTVRITFSPGKSENERIIEISR